MVADRDGDGEMTLVFELAAVREFADPSRVFADAREWSRYVGVVGNDRAAVAAFVDAHDLRQDLEVGDRDTWLAMAAIREATDTERHVFVGTTADDRRLADHLGWEFRSPGDVAAAAGWERESGDVGAGSARFLAWLRQRSIWPF